MKTKNLDNYINQKNVTNRIFGRTLIPGSNEMTQVQANSLFESIEYDLSPENLCCDGEASVAYVRSQGRMLYGAAQDLMKIGFSMPGNINI